ncbi:MAG: WG repeat-containing protein [Candidatus Erginobacter occultus]|nr:WG repeat-containing protein [Candidatus Erginobacter occultus]
MLAGFGEGLAAFVDSPSADGFLRGYIDQSGRVAITPRFRAAGEFSEGLAWVSV